MPNSSTPPPPQYGYPQGLTDYPSSQYGNPYLAGLEEEKHINWRKYIFIFLRNWYWFFITMGIGLGIAFFKVRYTIPKYEATATLIIEQDENSQDMISQLRTVRFWRRQADLANETAKIKSFTTIKRAVDSLHQDVFWTAHGRIRVRPLYNTSRYQITLLNDTSKWYKGQEWYVNYIDKTKYRLYREESLDTILHLDQEVHLNGWNFIMSLKNKGGHMSYSFVINDPVLLSKRYKNKLKVESDQELGTTITLKSQGFVGEHEADFLNALSSTYILSELERKQTIAQNTSIFIDEQINVILDSLKQSEAQLLSFRLTNNVINLSQEGEMAYDRLKSYNEQLTKLKLQEDYYVYLRQYVEKRNDPQTIIAPTLTSEGDQLLISAVGDLQELYKEREIIDLSAQPNNPKLESINHRVSSGRDRIIEIVNGLIENNTLNQKLIRTEQQAIINQIKTLPVNEQQLLNIKRKYDLYNQFYTFLLEKRAEAGIQKASTISNARILDPARHDQLTTVGSDKKITILIAGLLGLLLPGIALLLRDLMDNRIREREDVINHTNIPIIGVLGHAPNANIIQSKETASSAFSESLRRIRTNLTFALREKDKKVIMVTSSVSGEGKTFSAANLAAIIAMNRKKVLIMGCDLRKPSLHRVFNISNDAGITSCIIGSNKREEIIFPTTIDNLFIMPSGPIPPNPAELLETDEMNQLFEQTKKDFDYIIIDTPPIALVADTLSLAQYADLTLYLIRQNFSHKSVIELINSIQEDAKLPKTYLLINDINPSRSLGLNYYYGYGGRYNYTYYDYEYSTKKQKKV